MGKYLLDQYSFLHFSIGVVSYFWGINFILWILLHTIFEIIENTKVGIYIINNYILYWPGGKPKADSFMNMIGDSIGAILGWLAAQYVDKYGNKKGWYNIHIK